MVGGRDAIAELGAPAPRFYQEIARVVKPKTKVTIVD